MSTAAGRRGEPVVALAAILGAWVLARGVLLAMPGEVVALEASGLHLASTAAPLASAEPMPLAPALPIEPTVAPDLAAPAGPALPVPPTGLGQPVVSLAPPTFTAPLNQPLPQEPSGSARIAASHQLLYLAAFAQLPLPPEVFAARPDLAAPTRQAQLQSRWSGDGWLLWRQDSAALPVGGFAPASYGASQAGAVLRHRLTSSSPYQPLAYLRISSALASPGQPEAAIGLGARPIPRLPISVLAELRVSESGGRTQLRPAVAVVAGLPRQRLPFGFGVEAYGQAGYVAGPDASGFADGQARLDRQVTRLGSSELRGGGAVWGGAQRGAGRLDVGPTASVDLRLGSTSARLSADWRFRLAGQAAPTSGPAITLSAGF